MLDLSFRVDVLWLETCSIQKPYQANQLFVFMLKPELATKA